MASKIGALKKTITSNTKPVKCPGPVLTSTGSNVVAAAIAAAVAAAIIAADGDTMCVCRVMYCVMGASRAHVLFRFPLVRTSASLHHITGIVSRMS